CGGVTGKLERNFGNFFFGMKTFGSCINGSGRVEDWRAGVGRSLFSLFLALWVMRVSHHLAPAAYPAPATSNAACGFPRTALSCSFLATAYETGTAQVAFGTKYRTL